MDNGEKFEKESIKSRGFKFLLKATRTKTFWDKSGDDLMKAIETRRLLSDEPPEKLHETITIIKGEINGIYYYELHPKKEPSNKPIFYVHGGGYVYRISRLHWNFLAKFVEELNCIITVPLYPLAPEHTHEHSLDFVYKLYQQQIDRLENSENMILMGDSAGGGLSLILAQLLEKKQLPQPEQIILISPWLDVSMSNPDIEPIEEKDPFLVRSGLIEVGKMFAGETDTKHPSVSPLYGDLKGLPEITIIMGAHDILAADSRKFVELAKQQGQSIDYIEAENMVHIYPIYNFPESQIAFQQIVEKIKN